ncbi:2-oxo-3-hexenedioate decarboxylase [Pseudonocardia ammonioxydans]|uniref:2-oxo-3-hexenedioate decarboxylase n=1 Tax=Pseudonocardia ammonioxydans TaxID=260086 RepID=A0A1I4XFW9_PSUAM|nr:fumarylacetoacetate hydrolase family protein [Pseudonocardia ammonioxydans]SFN24794.1 2-oxo-3-hexenedioate decarboxylase [Pseudonocardia ammonioxydans]
MISPPALAAVLDDAVTGVTAVPQLTHSAPITLDDAYAIQRAGIERRTARGDAVVGVKLGLTSRAKAEQMGVSDVIVGVLTESMRVPAGGRLDTTTLIHPRVEPEIAFRLGSAIDPDDPACDPLAAVAGIAPALEIIDSRYRDFRFSLPDVVADNTSAAGFVIGDWQPADEVLGRLDVADLAVTLGIDGEIVESGSTGAILGDPLEALGAVTRMAARYGPALPAGTIVLAGAATAAAALPTGNGTTVTAEVAGLGTVTFETGGAAA